MATSTLEALPSLSDLSPIRKTDGFPTSTSTYSTPWPSLPISTGPYGSLTTQFIPPPQCTSLTYWESTFDGPKYNTTFAVTVLWNNYPDNTISGWKTCYPPGYAERSGSYYSPGICPQNWNSFLLSATARSATKQTEASAACCPAGYFFVANIAQNPDTPPLGSCFSTLSRGTVGISTEVGVNTRSIGPLFYGSIHALAMEVRWQATDSITPSFADDPLKAVVPGSNDSQSEPSPGQITVLAISLPLLLVFIILVSFCIFFRRHQRRRKHEAEKQKEQEKIEAGGEKKDVLDEAKELQKAEAKEWQKAELDGAGIEVHELPANDVPELPTCMKANRHEIEGDLGLLEMDGTAILENDADSKVPKKSSSTNA
jgi:hypothetical protein